MCPPWIAARSLHSPGEALPWGHDHRDPSDREEGAWADAGQTTLTSPDKHPGRRGHGVMGHRIPPELWLLPPRPQHPTQGTVPRSALATMLAGRERTHLPGAWPSVLGSERVSRRAHSERRDEPFQTKRQAGKRTAETFQKDEEIHHGPRQGTERVHAPSGQVLEYVGLHTDPWKNGGDLAQAQGPV